MIDFLNHWLPVIITAVAVASVIAMMGFLFALSQYQHFVEIARRNERRAAIELTARESTHFGAVLIPGFGKLRKQIENSGCQFFAHFKLIRSETELKPDAAAVTEDDYNRLNEHFPETLRLFNLLEGFAIPFAAGVADDHLGFVECGRSFVTTFEQFYGLYARHELKHYYPSTQAVYWKWRRQLENDDRRRMQLALGRDFFALTEEIIRNESKPGQNSLACWLLAKINLRKK